MPKLPPSLTTDMPTESLFTVYLVRNDLIIRLGCVREVDVAQDIAEAETRGRALTGLAVVWRAVPPYHRDPDEEVTTC